MPNESSNTLAIGARQLVVQDAQLITVSLPSRMLWFTLNTIVFRSPVAGAEITTRFAPAVRCDSAFALSVKKPVHSKTTSTSCCPQGISAGFFCRYTKRPILPNPLIATFTVLMFYCLYFIKSDANLQVLK